MGLVFYMALFYHLIHREADRVILTACQQQGANQSTFQAVSEQLGNKTASEVPELSDRLFFFTAFPSLPFLTSVSLQVSRRFRDLMRLFHTSACQASSEDEADEEQD